MDSQDMESIIPKWSFLLGDSMYTKIKFPLWRAEKYVMIGSTCIIWNYILEVEKKLSKEKTILCYDFSLQEAIQQFGFQLSVFP